MRYNQVKDLIEWAVGYHARMAQQYSAAAIQVDNQRLVMALNYLASRELKMKSGLEALFHDGYSHREVMEIWFDDSSDFPQPPRLEALVKRTLTGSIEDMTATAEASHRHLQELYEHRASRAKSSPKPNFSPLLPRATMQRRASL